MNSPNPLLCMKPRGDQAKKLRHRFELSLLVLVGDRGMLTETQMVRLRVYPGLGWISALRIAAIRDLAESGSVQIKRGFASAITFFSS